jgi:uncharacterized membrane protein
MAKRRNRRSSAERRIRAQELRREKNMDTAKKMMIMVAIVAIVAVAWMLSGKGGGGYEPSEGLTVNEQDEVELSSSDVTKTAQYYSIKDRGVKIRFFALRGSDGEVRVATDACDVCYDAKKGYRQEGNDMVCNNCGNRYASDGIGTKNLKGGCWPSYIPISEAGGKVLIKADDIKAKRFMFD